MSLKVTYIQKVNALYTWGHPQTLPKKAKQSIIIPLEIEGTWNYLDPSSNHSSLASCSLKPRTVTPGHGAQSRKTGAAVSWPRHLFCARISHQCFWFTKWSCRQVGVGLGKRSLRRAWCREQFRGWRSTHKRVSGPPSSWEGVFEQQSLETLVK